MAVHKIVLDDDFEEEFSLIAIHCSEEAYKVAYSLNQKLNLRLHRMSSDVEFGIEDEKSSFPIFEFEDEFKYTSYYLVGNKCKVKTTQVSNSGNLFDTDISERIIAKHLLPEFKEADFFLKIESDFDRLPLRKNIAAINEIKQVISAYEIDTSRIKSTNNLIFN
jgi:hypothetical protein